MKISKDNKYVMISRWRENRFKKREDYTEVICIDAIRLIKSHRVGEKVYSNDPGVRHGYDVMIDGGQWGCIWINDAEYKEICKLLGFEE